MRKRCKKRGKTGRKDVWKRIDENQRRKKFQRGK